MEDVKPNTMTYEQFCHALEQRAFNDSYLLTGALFGFFWIAVAIIVAGVQQTNADAISYLLGDLPKWALLWLPPLALGVLIFAITFMRFDRQDALSRATFQCQACSQPFGHNEADFVSKCNCCPYCRQAAFPCEEKGVFIDVPDEEIAPYRSSSPSNLAPAKLLDKPNDVIKTTSAFKAFVYPWRIARGYFAHLMSAAWMLSASHDAIAERAKERLERIGLHPNVDQLAEHSVKYYRRLAALWMLMVFVIPNTIVLGSATCIVLAPPFPDSDLPVHLYVWIAMPFLLPLSLGVSWILSTMVQAILLNTSPRLIRSWFGVAPPPLKAKFHENTTFYGCVTVVYNIHELPQLGQHGIRVRYSCGETIDVEIGLLNRTSQREYRITRRFEKTDKSRRMIIRFAPTLQCDDRIFTGDAVRFIPPKDAEFEVSEHRILALPTITVDPPEPLNSKEK
ncbi:MAG: hypothetical protein NXI22_02530 [bacterium]|nr:hypothetical protein [bacterium]